MLSLNSCINVVRQGFLGNVGAEIGQCDGSANDNIAGFTYFNWTMHAACISRGCDRRFVLKNSKKMCDDMCYLSCQPVADKVTLIVPYMRIITHPHGCGYPYSSPSRQPCALYGHYPRFPVCQ